MSVELRVFDCKKEVFTMTMKMTMTTIELDLAKNVFQAFGVDYTAVTVLVKRLHKAYGAVFFQSCLMPDWRGGV